MSASIISSHYIDSLGKYWGLEDTTFWEQGSETVYEYDYTNTCVTEIVKAGFITVVLLFHQIPHPKNILSKQELVTIGLSQIIQQRKVYGLMLMVRIQDLNGLMEA